MFPVTVMNRKKWLIATLCISTLLSVHGESEPLYISGDVFRNHADFIFDERTNSLDPSRVACGDIIFVKADYLEPFIRTMHDAIQAPYILITHNSDAHMPGQYAYLLDDPKIIAWFAQNVEGAHSKLHHLPLGIANPYWKHGDVRIFSRIRNQLKRHERKHLLYMNFDPRTYPSERILVYQLFEEAHYCFISRPKGISFFLEDLALSHFVLSPRGNGLDCHRTWEALYMGAVPIVRTSTLDPLYADLPILIISDWRQITPEFLHQTLQEMSKKSYNLEKLQARYWLDLLDSYKQQARAAAGVS